MNKLFRVLIVIFSTISLILSLVFIVLEFRLLVTFEWLVFDNNINGLIRYLLRLILAVFVFIVSLLDIIKERKNTIILNILVFFMSVILLLFATNYIGTISFILSLIILITKYLNIVKIK